MPFDDPATTATAVISAISLVFGLYGFGYKYGQLALKVDTMWDFQMKRARVEGEMNGFLEHGSDLRVKGGMKEILETSDLGDALLRWHHQIGRHIKNERDLFIAIEKEFGDELVDRICIPLKIYSGACLLGAVKYCQEHTNTKKNEFSD